MKTNEELKSLHGKDYVNTFEKEQSPFRLERLIDSIFLDNKYKIVDYACGNGMLMPFIANRVEQYIGVDFSEDFIKSANRKKKKLSISNAEFVCADIIDFCKNNHGVFDVAFAMDFSEHVYDPDWLNILSAIKNSLKSDGKLYLHTPNADFFLEIMKENSFILKQFPEHIAVRSPEENQDILEKAGFKINSMKLIPHYNILRFVHPLSLFPFIGKYFKARIFIEASPT